MQFGEKNNNWRGGRSVASNGYVLIRVGIEHHLADVRGYAYEHRMVAEAQLGRRLVAGEIVHHKNGIKDDNRPENLEVVFGNAEHFLHHRKNDSGRKLPGRENPVVECACGCGERFRKYDSSGRPRVFMSGHNPPNAPTQTAIMDLLKSSPMSRAELVRITGIGAQPVATCLSKLKRRGVVYQVSHGVWALNESIQPCDVPVEG